MSGAPVFIAPPGGMPLDCLAWEASMAYGTIAWDHNSLRQFLAGYHIQGTAQTADQKTLLVFQ